MAQVVVCHGKDRFIIRHVADDTGHIFVPRQFACPLPPVARYDLIAPALTGTHQGGLVDAACPHRRHQPFHFIVVPDAERVILERVELVEVQIDDLLFFRAGGVLGLGFSLALPDLPSHYFCHGFLGQIVGIEVQRKVIRRQVIPFAVYIPRENTGLCIYIM